MVFPVHFLSSISEIDQSFRGVSSLQPWIFLPYPPVLTATNLDLTRVDNGNRFLGGSARGSNPLDSLDDVQAFNNMAEDDVGTVEPLGLDGGEEELRAVAKSENKVRIPSPR